MKNKKWLYFILMLLPLAVSLIALPFLPSQIPAHYGADNQVTRWGSKYEALLLPLLTILFGLFMMLMARYAAKQEKSGGSNEKAVVITGLCSLLLFNLMNFYFLYTDFHQVENLSEVPVDLFSLVFLCLGIFLILCGALMPRLKNNSIIGLRTGWSRKNDITWEKSQKFGGVTFIISGFCMIAASLLTNGTACFLWSMAILLADTVISVWYTYRIAKRYS